MKMRRLLMILLFALPGAAWAQEQAFTNRSTELKDRGAPEARTLATLPEGTSVKVVSRGGGWTRIDANGQAGWVRVFHLRFPVVVAEASSSSGNALSSLGSALGLGGERSRAATTATTGIRGLSPEELKNARPDPAALQRLQSFRADQSAAERFAREGKLNTVAVEIEGGRR